ncbi:MAG: endonuclease/exonuclease/phosphatase family protein [Polyangiaceae bacterium]
MLRVATYNVLNLFDARTPAESKVIEAKVAFLAARIAESNADVVGLQEVGSEPLLDALLFALEQHVLYTYKVVGTPDRRGIRNVLLSRLPLKSSRVLTTPQLEFPRFVASDPAPYTRLPLRRGIPYAEIDGGSLGSVDVMVVHFKSGRGVPLHTEEGEPIAPTVSREYGEAMIRALVFRAAEALFVRGVVDELLVADPQRKVAVIGDFNDVIDSVPVRIIRGGGVMVLQSGVDHVPKEKRYTVMHGGDRKTIDHILASPALRHHLKHTQILNDHLHDHDAGYTDEPRADSDHALVVSSFE